MLKQNSLFLKSCRCEATERPPVWIMRQAGRYMPEYREIRKTYNFLEMCQTPELASQITMQPINAFGMDAAIIFSDILVTAQAMGGDLTFKEQEGPVFNNPPKSLDEIPVMSEDAVHSKLNYVFEAIKLTQAELPSDTPLIGFAGAPFTVGAYWLEGKLSKDLRATKKLLYQNPEFLHTVLQRIADVTVHYLNGQIKAGANALQIFDSWAHILTWDLFHEFSLKYVSYIISQLDNPKHIPVIYFCRASSVFAPLMALSGATVVGLDWNIDLNTARNAIDPKVALQGNFDPHLLYAPKTLIAKTIQDTYAEMDNTTGLIFNLGHGVLPDMDPEHIRHFVDTVKGL